MENYHHYFNFLNNRELNELYISVAIRAFALSMITVFIPIYLLKIGYSLVAVLVYYLVLRLSHTIFVMPAAKIATKVGFKHSILFSIPFFIIFYLLLYSLEYYAWPLYLLAIINGFNKALYWMGYHVDFCKFSQKKKRGKELSTAQILSQAFKAAGPFIGGLFLVFIGFKALLACVSVLLFVSAIPLFFSKDIHEPMNFSLKMFKGRKIKDFLTFAGKGMEGNMNLVVWPVIIFYGILNNYASLGLVSSLSIIFSVVCVIYIGKFVDIDRKLVLRLSAMALTFVWIVRYFVKSTLQVFFIDSFNGLAKTATYIPFQAMSYDKADKTNIVNFIMFREISINFGAALFFLILLWIGDLNAGFVIGAIAPFLYFLF